MLTARIDIIDHTSDTLDIQITVYPTASTDPELSGIDVLDNSVPPISLLGVPRTMPDCLRNYGVETPFLMRGIPTTRVPLDIYVTLCGTGERINLGRFLTEMSPTGAVRCTDSVILPPTQECLAAQGEVSEARGAFLRECTNITQARGRRDAAIAAAAATGAVGVGGAVSSAAIVAALLTSAGTVGTAVPYVGWIAAAVLATIAVVFIITAAVFLSRYNAAQNDLNDANQRQIGNLHRFHDAVEHVGITCCPQQLTPMLRLETPTCPA
jgi:hypothetical protein